MNEERFSQKTYLEWTPLFTLFLLGITCTAVMLAIRPMLLLPGAACCVYAFFLVSSLRRPLIFILVFLVVVITLPPLYFSSLGDTPFYLSSLLLPTGLAVLVTRLPDFSTPSDKVAIGLIIFLLATGLSLPFAWWLSGDVIGKQSLLRWLLLTQTALIFVVIRGVARWQADRAQQWLMPVLIIAAVASAAYGIFDFFWPVPLPHPAADQFIWLQAAVLRRAQGVAYEASSFGNLCGIFLVITAAAFLAGQEHAVRISWPWLLLFIAVLSFAVFLCFSRSVWASVLVSLSVFVWISRVFKFRRVWGVVVTLLTPLTVLWFYFPELWGYVTGNRIGYFGQIFADPNLVTSGRLEMWAKVFSILRQHPGYLLFGIGYKTLPFTRLFHQEIITDNGFLNLLLETGLLGLGGFLIFSASVFRSFWRLSRRADGTELFWSAAVFSLWCGEWVQMLAVDAYTYWRSMAVFLALMAFAFNQADRMQTELGADTRNAV
jgi:O-antigen ligase